MHKGNTGKVVRAGTELRDLVEWAKELGFECERTRGSHIRFRRPNTPLVSSSMTPSDHRAYMNTRAKLKRALREAEDKQLRQPS
jgi:predicted RNA binding protein YcfA (HicA-like mRNA interferase family)